MTAADAQAIHISVRGLPAPQGSKRHVGGGRMVEQSKAVGPWREAVRAETQRACRVTLTGPVQVRMAFILPRPKSHYGTGRNAGILRRGAPAWPAVSPDLDKLARSTLDGLVTGGAIADDSLVVILITSKSYPVDHMTTGVQISIRKAS